MWLCSQFQHALFRTPILSASFTVYFQGFLFYFKQSTHLLMHMDIPFHMQIIYVVLIIRNVPKDCSEWSPFKFCFHIHYTYIFTFFLLKMWSFCLFLF